MSRSGRNIPQGRIVRGPVGHTRSPTGLDQLTSRGIVACTVDLTLLFFVPVTVVTVSVTFTVTEFSPVADFLLTVPESTPVDESFSPLGSATWGATTVPFAHLT